MKGSMAMVCTGAAIVLALADGCMAADLGTPAAASPIEGHEWRLVSLRGLDAKTLGMVTDGVTVRFVQGQVQGFGGCNRLAGTYTVAGDHVTIGALAGTMMACAPPATAVESAFTKAFAGTLRFRVDERGLTLTPPSDSEPTLAFSAAPPPRLDGVTWEVTGYNNGRQAVVSPLVGTRLTVKFADAAVAGSAGCNTFRAPYTVDGNRITVGSPATTRMQCADDVMAQEREFLGALQSATVWTLDRGLLDMHRADGERVLHARPAP